MSPSEIEPESGFSSPVIRLEQRRLAGAVRADHADDAAGRQLEGEIVDQQAIAIALRKALDLDDLVAEALADRNDDLRRLHSVFSCDALDQLVIGT